MIITNQNESLPSKDFTLFLRKEFSLSESAINLAIKQSQSEAAPISIILLRLGLISLIQYEVLLDWLQKRY